MKFDPVTFTLHDGRECALRSAEPEDAAALVGYVNQVFGESPYLIANRMLQTLLDCARACGYEQVELEVVADNFRAVPLYLKHGFQVYGTRPHALRYPDGSYASEYLMYKKL